MSNCLLSIAIHMDDASVGFIEPEKDINRILQSSRTIRPRLPFLEASMLRYFFSQGTITDVTDDSVITVMVDMILTLEHEG